MTPTSRIHDLSTQLGKGAIEYEGERAVLRRDIVASTRAISDGLYVALYENNGEDVRDNNKGGDGKVVIPARSRMLKYGKFEKGVVERYQEQLDHLRRGPADAPEKYIYGDLVKLVLVLDLTSLKVGPWSPARVFEPFWNGSIEHWLIERGHRDVGGRKRIESRVLKGDLPAVPELTAELRRLEERIFAAAPALSGR